MDLGQEERGLKKEIEEAIKKSPRLVPTNFAHVSTAEAKSDEVKAIEIRRGYKFKGGKERGTLLEQFMQQRAERSNWFGSEASVFPTTDHDDLLNGTDAVIEWPKEEGEAQFPRLAVDFTTSSSLEGLETKLAKIKQPARIKYLRSEVELNDEGDPTDMSVSRLPMVVLGLDDDLLGSFAKDIQRARKTPVPNPKFDEKKYKEDKMETPGNRRFISPAILVRDVLENSPYKILLLLQARAQLTTQGDNPLAKQCYDRVQLELERLMYAKDEKGRDLDPKKDSPVYQRALKIGKNSTTHRELTFSA